MIKVVEIYSKFIVIAFNWSYPLHTSEKQKIVLLENYFSEFQIIYIVKQTLSSNINEYQSTYIQYKSLQTSGSKKENGLHDYINDLKFAKIVFK